VSRAIFTRFTRFTQFPLSCSNARGEMFKHQNNSEKVRQNRVNSVNRVIQERPTGPGSAPFLPHDHFVPLLYSYDASPSHVAIADNIVLH
jgi:hypothetical protein